MRGYVVNAAPEGTTTCTSITASDLLVTDDGGIGLQSQSLSHQIKAIYARAQLTWNGLRVVPVRGVESTIPKPWPSTPLEPVIATSAPWAFTEEMAARARRTVEKTEVLANMLMIEMWK